LEKRNASLSEFEKIVLANSPYEKNTLNKNFGRVLQINDLAEATKRVISHYPSYYN